jgi:hypothetical protein
MRPTLWRYADVLSSYRLFSTIITYRRSCFAKNACVGVLTDCHVLPIRVPSSYAAGRNVLKKRAISDCSLWACQKPRNRLCNCVACLPRNQTHDCQTLCNNESSTECCPFGCMSVAAIYRDKARKPNIAGCQWMFLGGNYFYSSWQNCRFTLFFF